VHRHAAVVVAAAAVAEDTAAEAEVSVEAASAELTWAVSAEAALAEVI
jgi:hypothetical protein